MNDKEILQLNMGNMPKAGRDEINRQDLEGYV